MAKKKSSNKKHQSFKMSPHGHARERVWMYIALAAVVGVVIGYMLKDEVAAVLGVSTLVY